MTPASFVAGFWCAVYYSLATGVILVLLYGVGIALYSSWLASRRKPLESFQYVVGSSGWKYADLSGGYDEVERSVRDLLRSMCAKGSVREYGIPDVLAGETKLSFWNWISGSELLVQVERMDPTVTRVQVLSRSLVDTEFDFGANKRLAGKFIGRLRQSYTDVSMVK